MLLASMETRNQLLALGTVVAELYIVERFLSRGV